MEENKKQTKERDEKNSTPVSKEVSNDACSLGARSKTKRGFVGLDLKEKMKTEIKRLDAFLVMDKKEIELLAYEPIFFATNWRDFWTCQQPKMFVFNKLKFHSHFNFTLVAMYLSRIPQVIFELFTFDNSPLIGYQKLSKLLLEISDNSCLNNAALKLQQLGEEFQSLFKKSDNYNDTECGLDNPATPNQTCAMIFIKGADPEKTRQKLIKFIGKITQFFYYSQELEVMFTSAARVEHCYRKRHWQFDAEKLANMSEFMRQHYNRQLVLNFNKLIVQYPFELLFEDLKSYSIKVYDSSKGTLIYLHQTRQFEAEIPLPEF